MDDGEASPAGEPLRALGPDPANPRLPSVDAGARCVLDRIAWAEGTDDEAAQRRGIASGYEVAFGYRPTRKPLTAMTLDEIDKLQSAMTHTPVGRYQITRRTLRALRVELRLAGDQLFTPELQDRLGRRLMTESGYDTPGLSVADLQAGFARQWASIATANGLSVDPAQRARLSPSAFFETIALARRLEGEA